MTELRNQSDPMMDHGPIEATRERSPESLHLRVLQMVPARNEGPIVAFACVEFGPWIVRGVRLMRRDDGSTWLAMPSQKNPKGEYFDVCFIPSRAARERLHRALVHANQTKANAPETPSRIVDDHDDLPF